MSEADELVVRLDGHGVPNEVAGGKGSSLDRLVAHGANVPATSVVTTAAYRLFAADPAIATLLEELRTGELPDPEDHERELTRVDEAFLQVDLPSPIVEAIEEYGPPMTGGALLAVRSSATAEDTASASFAGQYRSYLEVDAESVSRSLRLVWSSLWHPAPRSYRRFRSIPEDDLSMAVVLMAMLDPSHAGVIFTTDPGGAADHLRLEVVEGLGEALVSGEATPDAYVLDRADAARQMREVNPVLGSLVDEALRVEDELGAPQDIEWAIQRDELFLVQARPITTEAADVGNDDGFDVNTSPEATYTTAGIGESIPGVVPPLDWSVNSWAFENGFRRLFDRLGGCPDGLEDAHALIGRFRGRAALNLDMMLTAASSIPGASPEELEHQYFGEAVRGPDAKPAPTPPKAGAAQGLRTLRARQSAAQESEVVTLAVEDLLVIEPELGMRPDEELLAYRGRLLHLGTRCVTAEVTVAAMATASYRSIEAFLCQHLGDEEASRAAQLMTSGSGGSRRATIALAMSDLVPPSQRTEQLRSATAHDDWAAAEAALSSFADGREFLSLYSAALAKAGSTSYFGGPTWAEVPELAWLTFRQEVAAPKTDEADAARQAARSEIEQRLLSDPAWRQRRLSTGQLFDVRRRFFRREAADAAEFLDRREHTKAAMLKLGGALRRLNLELGRRLVEEGRLEQVDDVLMVSNAELVAMIEGRGPTLDTVALRRRRLNEADLDGPLPRVFAGTPEVVQAPTIEGEHVEGWGASPGRYEGPARVVRSVTESTLVRGDVLVAQATDASWAPLFLLAGAIVVEDGGPLSHAAIVARELGMPAVLNVPGLIDRLESESGQVMLRVDGTSGELILHLPDSDDGGATDELVVLEEPAAEERSVDLGAGVAPLRSPVEPEGDINRMNVFVTGLIGAGALFSTAIALTESMSSRRGRNRLYRKAEPVARTLSEGTSRGYDSEHVRMIGVRPRHHYLIGTLVLALASIGLAIVSTRAYIAEDGGTSSNVAFWALSVSGAATLGMLAVYAGNAVATWPHVLPTVRQLAAPKPSVENTWLRSIKRSHLYVIVGLLAVVAVLAVLGAAWESVLLEVDEELYTRWELGNDRDRFGPEFLVWLGRPIVIIPLAIAIGIGSARCRVVALAFPLAVVVAGISNLLFTYIVRRERPPLSDHVGEITSFPGGHFMQMTLLFGVIPLVAYILTGRRWVQVIVGLLSLATLAMIHTDTFITGGHWPTDQLAGLLIGLALVIGIWSLSEPNALHESCHDCPGSRPRDGVS